MPAGHGRDSHELEVLGQMSAPLNAVRGYSSPELQLILERSAALAERLGRVQVQLSEPGGTLCGPLRAGTHLRWPTSLRRRALALAEEGAEPELLGQAHFAFAASATSLGMLTTAIPHFDLAYDLSRGAVSYVLGTRIEVHARAWAAHAHWLSVTTIGLRPCASARSNEPERSITRTAWPWPSALRRSRQQIRKRQGRAGGHRRGATRRYAERYEFAYYSEWALILDGWADGGEDGSLAFKGYRPPAGARGVCPHALLAVSAR